MSVSQPIYIAKQLYNKKVMDTKLFALTLITVLFLIDASPVKRLIFDDIAGIPDEYDVEEEDLDDYSKLLDADDKTGYNKKYAESEGSKRKHNIKDLKRLYKLVGAHDRGNDNDYNIYLDADAIAVGAVGENVKKTNKFKKGSKTRGFHRVHHKDEYKKDKEFYEDKETSGDVTRYGKDAIALLGKAGGGLHKKHFHHDRQKGIFGRRDYLDKGSADNEYDGYSDSLDLDESNSK